MKCSTFCIARKPNFLSNQIQAYQRNGLVALYVKVQQAHQSHKVTQVQALCSGVYTTVDSSLILCVFFDIWAVHIESCSINDPGAT